jgi:protein tyrosine/serine phosphatase
VDLRLIFLVMAIACAGCAGRAPVHGIPNFAEVSPGIYRGGQPAGTEGWRYLQALGVQRVVKLNSEAEGSDVAAGEIGLEVVSIALPPASLGEVFQEPAAGDVFAAVEAMRAGNVFVHCTHGEDRTGLVVGTYRVVAQGWTKERAWREMIARGYHPLFLGLDKFWSEEVPEVLADCHQKQTK